MVCNSATAAYLIQSLRDWQIGRNKQMEHAMTQSGGYTSGYDAWNVQGIYTWNRLTGSRSGISNDWSPAGGIGFFINTPFLQSNSDLAASGYFQVAAAHWRMNYNVGDIQFGRGFFITKALALQPLLGARMAFLKQKGAAYFIANGAHFLSNFNPWAYKFALSTSFSGAGPRIGVDGKWTLPYNLGVTGLVSGALLYGKLKKEAHWFEPPLGTGASFEATAQRHHSSRTIVPNAQAALGLDWGMSFDKERIYWGLNLGWEFNYWWQPIPKYPHQWPQHFEIQGLTLRTDLHF